MRGSHKSCRPYLCRKLILLAAFFAFLVLLPAAAQKAQGNDPGAPKYDAHTETAIKEGQRDRSLDAEEWVGER
jgi:hypothetical protein